MSCNSNVQATKLPLSLKYKSHLSRQLNCWSLRCRWSIACRRCSNYIFILDLTPGFNGLGKDNCKTTWEWFKFWDLVHLILEILRYISLALNCWHIISYDLLISSIQWHSSEGNFTKKPQPSITKVSLNIFYLKFPSNCSEAHWQWTFLLISQHWFR